MTIELTDGARAWLMKNGYDKAPGARPMARVNPDPDQDAARRRTGVRSAQGRGVVKVVVTADETGAKKFSFVYPEGPVQPEELYDGS